MTATAPDAVAPREPFAGVPVRDVVRDVVAVVALFVGLALPWDAAHRGADLLVVVLVTVVALVTVGAPYARRAGLWWARFGDAGSRTRVAGAAPLLVAALVQIVVDAAPGGGQGVGAGLGLAVAGALLVAVPTWPGALPLAAGLLALGAVLTPLLTAVDGGGPADVTDAVLSALLVLAILAVTVGDHVRRGAPDALVTLVGVGATVALAAGLLAGSEQGPWVESLHGVRFGVLLLPVVAAVALPRTVEHAVVSPAEPQVWAGVARRSLFLAAVVSLYVALVALSGLALRGFSVEFVLRLIVGLLAAAVAVIGWRALHRDVTAGHATAVGTAIVLVVLGIVITVARTGVSTRSTAEELLLAFGLPAMVLATLLVPPSLRELRGKNEPAEAHDATQGAAPAAVPAPAPAAVTREVAPDGGHGAGDRDHDHGERPAPVPAAPAGAPARVGQNGTTRPPRPAESAAEATAVLPPVTGQGPTAPQSAQPAQPVAQPAASQPAGPAQPVAPAAQGAPRPAQPPFTRPQRRSVSEASQTQVLPPVVDVPGARWKVAQASDPATPLADLAVIVQEAPHLRPHVAANPSTYPALLDWLGALGDPAVDAALRARRG